MPKMVCDRPECFKRTITCHICRSSTCSCHMKEFEYSIFRWICVECHKVINGCRCFDCRERAKKYRELIC